MKNNRINTYALLVLIISFLSGCASNVAVDYDQQLAFTNLKTFQVISPSEIKTDDPRLNSTLVTKRINKAIISHLVKRNFKLQDSNPDFYLTYILQSKQEISSTNSGLSFGFGHGFGRYSRGSFGMIYTFPENDVYSYDKAIVTIDVLDTKKQLIWRGSSSHILDRTATPQKSDQKIHQIVNDILSHFPPQK